MGWSIEVGRKRPAHGVGNSGGVEVVERETGPRAGAFVVGSIMPLTVNVQATVPDNGTVSGGIGY